MPTLEERLAILERLASDMRSEHISDIQQLYERISILQQQLVEQKKRLADHEQGTQQKFDGLVTVLMQQFKNMDTHFVNLDQRMDKLDQRAAKTEQWMVSIKEGLDNANLYAVMTRGIVEKQDENIRAIRGRLDMIDGKISKIDQIDSKVNQLDDRIGQMDSKMDDRFGEHAALLTQILARLPEKPL